MSFICKFDVYINIHVKCVHCNPLLSLQIQVFNRLGKTHEHEVLTPSYIRIQLKMDRCENILLNGCLCT